MNKYSVETYVNPVIYNRVKGTKEATLNALRQMLEDQYENLNWETEVITETLEKYSNRRCEDKLLVKITVDQWL